MLSILLSSLLAFAVSSWAAPTAQSDNTLQARDLQKRSLWNSIQIDCSGSDPCCAVYMGLVNPLRKTYGINIKDLYADRSGGAVYVGNSVFDTIQINGDFSTGVFSTGADFSSPTYTFYIDPFENTVFLDQQTQPFQYWMIPPTGALPINPTLFTSGHQIEYPAGMQQWTVCGGGSTGLPPTVISTPSIQANVFKLHNNYGGVPSCCPVQLVWF